MSRGIRKNRLIQLSIVREITVVPDVILPIDNYRLITRSHPSFQESRHSAHDSGDV
jgi:hypothetical protein